MSTPVIYVNLKPDQPEPHNVTSFGMVRRLPVEEWPLIILFKSRWERDKVFHEWKTLGYEVKAGETVDVSTPP